MAVNKVMAKVAARVGKPIDRHQMAARIHHSECALLLFSQIMLYGTLAGVEVTGSAQWWLTLLQFVPGLSLFFLMRLVLKMNPGQNLMSAFQKSLGAAGSAFAVSLYALLLLLDAWFTLHVLTEIVAAYVIKLPAFRFIGLTVAAACLIAVLIGGTDGTGRMVYLLRWVLFFLLAMAAFSSLQMGNLSNLFPYLGPGVKPAAAVFVNGSGAVWPVVLMGFVPEEPNAPMPWRAQRPAGLLQAAVAILLAALPMFCYCFVQPYDILMAPGSWGSRVVGFLRSSPYKWIWECFLIYAMNHFLCALCSSMSIFSYLATKGVFKKAKRAFMAVFFGAGLVVFAHLHLDAITGLFEKLMPWRFVAAAAPLIAAVALSLLKNRRRLKKVRA